VEDGFFYSWFVWWVAVVDLASRTVWHHAHAARVPASGGDVTPEEIVRLVSRVEAAVADGMGADHFETSPHWSGEPYETLEERYAPFGTEWQLEQKERDSEPYYPTFSMGG
jgi:hypothetical protein